MVEDNLISVVKRRAFDLCIPRTIQFELTYRCNYRCIHCYIPFSKSHKKEMNFKQVCTCIDKLAKAKAGPVIRFTGGECLLRKDFFDIASYAKKKGFVFKIATNGYLIDAKLVDKIADANPLTVEVSMHGITKKTYERITGVRGSFEKCINAIKLLRSRKIFTHIQFSLMRDNFHEYGKMIAFAKRMGCSIAVDPTLVRRRDGDEKPLKYLLTDKNFQKFLSDWYKRKRFKTYPYKILRKKISTPICLAAITTVAITPQGKVKPCIAFNISKYNLLRKSFNEIWNSSDFKKMRNTKWRDLAACIKCGYADNCTRCPAQAYNLTGDIKGLDPYECHRAALIKKTNLKYFGE